ncbi:MAG: helix-turn-helix transcriptional regulator [Acidibacillus sp.]|nr:helix-turn-helix transcriptional regulator [Acidibacillus sp.]
MLGNHIAKYRKAKGLTQQQLADAISIERTTLSKFENSAWQPSADTMKAISDILQVPLGEIFFNPDVLNFDTNKKAVT